MSVGCGTRRPGRLQYSCCHESSSAPRRTPRLRTLKTLCQSSTARVNTTRQAMTVEPLSPNEVWYFAYGSNMNPGTLTGRRMVRPQQSLPCKLPDHMLSFSVLGFPYAEPGFATIVPLAEQQHQQHPPPQSGRSQQQQTRPFRLADVQHKGCQCVHGVLHRITKREWQFVQATEGVGNQDVGYQVVTVACQLYDGQTVVQAQTLQSAVASRHSSNRQALPSQRYLRILQEGARHHQLNPDYQLWLARLPAYQPADMLQQTLGTMASGAVLAAATAPALPLYIASRALGLPPQVGRTAGKHNTDATTQQPCHEAASQSCSGSRVKSTVGYSGEDVLPFFSWYANQAQNLTWWVHDNVMSSVLGSGCSNEHSEKW